MTGRKLPGQRKLEPGASLTTLRALLVTGASEQEIAQEGQRLFLYGGASLQQIEAVVVAGRAAWLKARRKGTV